MQTFSLISDPLDRNLHFNEIHPELLPMLLESEKHWFTVRCAILSQVGKHEVNV